MSDSEAVAIVQGMLAEQRKQDAARQVAYLEAQEEAEREEKEMWQEVAWQLDMDSAKAALLVAGLVLAFIFTMTVF